MTRRRGRRCGSRSSVTVASNAAAARRGDRVGDRPVQPGRVGVELLVGAVADRHHERRTIRDVVEQLRVGVGEVEAGAAGGGDGAGVDPFGRVGAGAVGRLVGELRPQGGGQLGSGRVVGAHEQRPPGGRSAGRAQAVEGVAVEVDVAAAAVTAGAAAGDQPDLLEHVEVVGEQVRRDAGEVLQLDRRAVRADELVDDGQTGGIAERGVPLRTEHHRIHALQTMAQ